MAMLGLDPGRVESEIKVPFKKCSTDIGEIIKTLSSVVNNNVGGAANAAWTGADAEQFKNDWTTHQAKLQEVQGILDKAYAALTKNIEMQQSTSSGGSGTF